MKLVKDLWILKSSGIVLFHRVYHERVDPNLFGALMSALNAYASELADGGLSSFELHNQRYTFMKKDDFIFIANSSRKVKEKRILSELEEISKKFFDSYPNDFFEKWNGEVSVFSNFEHQIEPSLAEISERFREAFW
ncbi:MAG: hypothetical protein GF353_21035 [Candidatus Lokiarchaeota archaeon]|nr:hypothetical protein [Candidatus Lokiarchaeota archaeon]